MSKLLPGQLKYLLRESFNSTLPIFCNGVCRNKEQLEQIILGVRAKFLSKDPVFWCRPVSDVTEGETAYFVGLKNIVKARYPICIPDYDACAFRGWENPSEVSEKNDEEVISQLLSPENSFKRDVAYIRGLIVLQHPEIMVTLPEFQAYNRTSSIWEHKFPGVEFDWTGLNEEITYGRRLAFAGDILNQFVKLIGGQEMPEELKKELDDMLQ